MPGEKRRRDSLAPLKEALAAAEDQWRRRKADLDAVTAFLAGYTPTMPDDPDHATVALWNMKWDAETLREAKQDLRDADRALDRAKQDIRDAKQDIRDAKQDLQETKATPEHALTEHLATFEQATMCAPSVRTQRRAGNATIEKQIADLFVQPNSLQETTAAALIGASGVGKTFTALTYPTGEIREEYAATGKKHVMFYSGFNSDCPLTGDEEEYLKKSATDAAKAVAVVVLGRLLACLSVALRHPEALARPADTDVHNILHNVHSDALLSAPVAPTSTLLQQQCVKMLQELESVLFPGAVEVRLTVLVNADEAQFLDKHVPKEDGRFVGARYAMRCLRQLQLAVSQATNGRVSVLGLATGINPQMSLAQKTEGSNVVVHGFLTEKEHFEAIASTIKGPGTVTRNIQLAAAVTYPRVREFVLAITPALVSARTKNTVVFDNMTDDQIKECIKELVNSFVMRVTMHSTKIPVWCTHDNATESAAIPFLDLPVWQDLTAYLMKSEHRPTFRFPTVLEILDVSCEWQKLESTSGKIIYIILMLFFQAPERSGLMPTTVSYFRGKRELGATLASALGIRGDEQLVLNRDSFIILPNKSTNYHPFKGLGSHAGAIDRGLSTEFKAELTLPGETEVKRTLPGETRLFHCGGSAPIDYIMLRHAAGDKVHLSYIDAKYSVHTDKDLKKEMRDVRDKAAKVHAGLTTELKKMSLEVEPQYAVSIVTNVNVRTAIRGVSVICPTTFSFTPLSSVMYEALPEEEEEKKENEEEGEKEVGTGRGRGAGTGLTE